MKTKSFFFRISNLLIVLLTCSFTAQLRGQCTNIHPDDLAALQALYRSTDGDHWLINRGWDQIMNSTTPTLCDLERVVGIDFIGSRVVRINLEGLIIEEHGGSIPEEIGDMTSLQSLYLDNTNLNGHIPASISNLTNLINLSMIANHLTGNIPEGLGNLVNLRELSLLHNGLTGSIPAELGNLINLDYLILEFNSLTGHIPGELGNLTNLVQLSLVNNDLSGCFHPNLRNLCGVMVFLDDAEFEVPWRDFCDGLGGTCDSEPCVSESCDNNSCFFPESCELPKEKIIEFALSGTECPVVEYRMTNHEGLPLPDTLFADRYEYCKPVLFTYKCENGQTYEKNFKISSDIFTQEFISMTMQKYLSGTTLYNVRGCPGTYTFEDEEQYRSCELTRIKRTWRYTDICGNCHSGIQSIDIRNFFFCRFVGPFRLPEGIKSWIRLDLPKKVNLKGLKFEWSVKSNDWKVLGQKGPTLLIRPGRGRAEIGLKIYFPTGLTLDVYGKFESYKAGIDKLENPDRSNLPISGEDIKVYPNPSHSEITVQLPWDLTDRQVLVINHLGQVVRRKEIQGAQIKMSVSEWSPGVYALRFSNGESIVVKRFIKM